MTTVLYNGAASKIHEAFQESMYSGAMIYTAFTDACPTQHPPPYAEKSLPPPFDKRRREAPACPARKKRGRGLPPRHSRSGNSATAAASSLARRIKRTRLAALPNAVPIPAGHPHGADRRHAGRRGIGRVRAAAVRQRPEILQPPAQAGLAQVVKQGHTGFGARHGAAPAEDCDGRNGAGNVGRFGYAPQIGHSGFALRLAAVADVHGIRAGLGTTFSAVPPLIRPQL